MGKMRIGFLASHGGSNMQAIIDACKDGSLNMDPVVIISNNKGSTALERAERENIPGVYLSSKTHSKPQQLDKAICDTLQKYNVDLVVLAGYMKKIGVLTLASFQNKILNIHPALLPKYGGKGMFGIHVHEAVIANKEKESGATIHLVDDKYDHGTILNQVTVPVFEGDTPETLQKRVLKQEHFLYSDTLKKIEKGEIVLTDKQK